MPFCLSQENTPPVSEYPFHGCVPISAAANGSIRSVANVRSIQSLWDGALNLKRGRQSLCNGSIIAQHIWTGCSWHHGYQSFCPLQTLLQQACREKKQSVSPLHPCQPGTASEGGQGPDEAEADPGQKVFHVDIVCTECQQDVCKAGPAKFLSRICIIEHCACSIDVQDCTCTAVCIVFTRFAGVGVSLATGAVY